MASIAVLVRPSEDQAGKKKEEEDSLAQEEEELQPSSRLASFLSLYKQHQHERQDEDGEEDEDVEEDEEENEEVFYHGEGSLLKGKESEGQRSFNRGRNSPSFQPCSFDELRTTLRSSMELNGAAGVRSNFEQNLQRFYEDTDYMVEKQRRDRTPQQSRRSSSMEYDLNAIECEKFEMIENLNTDVNRVFGLVGSALEILRTSEELMKKPIPDPMSPIPSPRLGKSSPSSPPCSPRPFPSSVTVSTTAAAEASTSSLTSLEIKPPVPTASTTSIVATTATSSSSSLTSLSTSHLQLPSISTKLPRVPSPLTSPRQDPNHGSTEEVISNEQGRYSRLSQASPFQAKESPIMARIRFTTKYDEGSKSLPSSPTFARTKTARDKTAVADVRNSNLFKSVSRAFSASDSSTVPDQKPTPSATPISKLDASEIIERRKKRRERQEQALPLWNENLSSPILSSNANVLTWQNPSLPTSTLSPGTSQDNNDQDNSAVEKPLTRSSSVQDSLASTTPAGSPRSTSSTIGELFAENVGGESALGNPLSPQRGSVDFRSFDPFHVKSNALFDYSDSRPSIPSLTRSRGQRNTAPSMSAFQIQAVKHAVAQLAVEEKKKKRREGAGTNLVLSSKIAETRTLQRPPLPPRSGRKSTACITRFHMEAIREQQVQIDGENGPCTPDDNSDTASLKSSLCDSFDVVPLKDCNTTQDGDVQRSSAVDQRLVSGIESKLFQARRLQHQANEGCGTSLAGRRRNSVNETITWREKVGSSANVPKGRRSSEQIEIISTSTQMVEMDSGETEELIVSTITILNAESGQDASGKVHQVTVIKKIVEGQEIILERITSNSESVAFGHS